MHSLPGPSQKGHCAPSAEFDWWTTWNTWVTQVIAAQAEVNWKLSASAAVAENGITGKDSEVGVVEPNASRTSGSIPMNLELKRTKVQKENSTRNRHACGEFKCGSCFCAHFIL